MRLVVRRLGKRGKLIGDPLVLAIDGGEMLPAQRSLRVVSEVGEPVKVVVEFFVDGDRVRIEGDPV